LSWLRYKRYLTENQNNLRLGAQSTAMPAIFQPPRCKKSTRHSQSGVKVICSNQIDIKRSKKRMVMKDEVSTCLEMSLTGIG